MREGGIEVDGGGSEDELREEIQKIKKFLC